MPSTVRNALPSVQCAHLARSTGERCRRYAIPGAVHCPKHRGSTDVEAAEERATLATLMASSRRPVWEVVLDAVHYADAAMRDAAADVTDADGTAPTADQLDRLLSNVRLAHKLGATAVTTRAAEMRDHVATLEAAGIAAVIESALSGVFQFFASLGMSDADSAALKRHVALSVRAALEAVPDSPRDHGGKPRIAPASPPPDLDHLVLVDRAELESMRNTIMRLRPQLDTKPAPVYVPDDSDATPPVPPGTPGSVSELARRRRFIHSSLAQRG